VTIYPWDYFNSEDLGSGNTTNGMQGPWIETHGLFGSYTIYDTSPTWPWPEAELAPTARDMQRRMTELERKVHRLETAQRRWPKRKAHR